VRAIRGASTTPALASIEAIAIRRFMTMSAWLPRRSHAIAANANGDIVGRLLQQH
jgi:hypothetical protein